MVTKLEKVRGIVRKELFKDLTGYYPSASNCPDFGDKIYEINAYVHANYFRKKREMFPELCDEKPKKKKNTKFGKLMSYKLRWYWYWKKRRAKSE